VLANGHAFRAAQSYLNNIDQRLFVFCTLSVCSFVSIPNFMWGVLFVVFFFIASTSGQRRSVSGRKPSGKQRVEFEIGASHTRFEIR